MQSRQIKQDHFLLALLALCGFYLAFEMFFNRHAILSVDEFWFAHRTYQYKDLLPYRDFAPYKTVLGYYLLLIPMQFAHGAMQTLIFTKQALALLNSLILFTTGYWLTRHFSRAGVLTSLSMLVTAEMVLSYSTNLRVDLLGYWFGFFALLCLLEKRVVLAGLLLGLGFITTQKTIWYLTASNSALLITHFLFATNRFNFRPIIKFNAAFASVVSLYLAYWSWRVDAQTVFTSVFLEAQAMYLLTWYDSARALFWQVITQHNPLIFFLWPLTAISLVVTYPSDQTREPRTFVVTFSLVILACLLPYKQVFPYYMQVTIPVVFTLYVAFFTWFYGLFNLQTAPTLLIRPKTLIALLNLYLICFALLSVSLQWPTAYLLMALVPMLFAACCTQAPFSAAFNKLYLQLICICFIFIGGIYPAIIFSLSLANNNGDYQKANIAAVNDLLQDGEDYLAGIELIYNKTQPIAGLRHLMGPAIDYLSTPTPALRAVMLASLYEDPNASTTSVIAALKQSNVKFYVNNYRIMALPAPIREYLQTEYAHYWGSIYLYAPAIAANNTSFQLKFSGNYLIASTQPQTIQLNHREYKSGTQVYLTRGHYDSKATYPYRLKLMPSHPSAAQVTRFQQDDWGQLLS